MNKVLTCLVLGIALSTASVAYADPPVKQDLYVFSVSSHAKGKDGLTTGYAIAPDEKSAIVAAINQSQHEYASTRGWKIINLQVMLVPKQVLKSLIAPQPSNGAKT